MNDIVLKRFREICPPENPENKTLDELIADTNVAFKIIGYEPHNMEANVKEIYLEKNHTVLSEFIYDVWELDS